MFLFLVGFNEIKIIHCSNYTVSAHPDNLAAFAFTERSLLAQIYSQNAFFSSVHQLGNVDIEKLRIEVRSLSHVFSVFMTCPYTRHDIMLL